MMTNLESNACESNDDSDSELSENSQLLPPVINGGEELTDSRITQCKRVCVVVLGDIGRSPRMQMHALSLAKTGCQVDLLGFDGSRPSEEVLQHPNIGIHLMSEAPNFQKFLPRILAWGCRVAWQAFSLFFNLILITDCDIILSQNPPSVPTLPVCWFLSRVRRQTFIVDWHNYGFTILSLSTRPQSLAVKVYKWIEGTFGSKADGHLCVTRALQADLFQRFNVTSKVLYDRPGEQFKPISLEEKHHVFTSLSEEYPVFQAEGGTIFTMNSLDGEIKLREDRPALIVSSTSWTEDEDFSILLKALSLYDQKENVPPVICIITGKGPLKDFYLKLIQGMQFEKVTFVLPWLEAEMYPKVVASADLGVSLHVSSSNLDLPMKVVDMFGCGLPVCAFKYECLNELVVHGKNGLHFVSSQQLADQLIRLLKSFPKDCHELLSFRSFIQDSFKQNRWHDNWIGNARELFTGNL